MSEILSNIKCAKCQQNAETEPNRNEFTITYPIRDKDGQIYCWDCYKNKSHCEGCGKSVANLTFSKSGNPTYPHAGGYGRQCERVWNKVNFICSKKCGEDIFAKKYQAWKDKLSQGWTKCEECWKFWSEEYKGGENFGEWIKEEKNQRGFIKLVAPGEGKLCKEHKSWEEGGKQWYDEVKNQAQKEWDNISYEERLKLVRRERPGDKNCEEMAARQEIDPLVLSRFIDKDSHRRYNCPDSDCCYKNYPSQLPQEGNDNNLSGSNGSNSESSEQQGKGKDNAENQQNVNHNSQTKNPTGNNFAGLVVGGIAIAALISLATILVIKNKKVEKK